MAIFVEILEYLIFFDQTFFILKIYLVQRFCYQVLLRNTVLLIIL